MMQWLALLPGTDHSRLGGASYFPKNFAEPDILFVLKPQGDTDSKEMMHFTGLDNLFWKVRTE